MSEQTQEPDYLVHCQTWQGAINRQKTIESKRELLVMAFKELKGLSYRGSRKVIVHGEGVLHIPDGADSFEESIWPWMQFKEVQAKGWLGKLYALVQSDEITITWPIYDAYVLGPLREEELTEDPDLLPSDEIPLEINRRLNRPLHFPVGLIDFAACHAD